MATGNAWKDAAKAVKEFGETLVDEEKLRLLRQAYNPMYVTYVKIASQPAPADQEERERWQAKMEHYVDWMERCRSVLDYEYDKAKRENDEG